ncbi:MAG TPA: hypothetical protein VKE69_02585 [Planctomycetota bacterium]|nr:hypothetical protein [Planctomycetota bacterium]
MTLSCEEARREWLRVERGEEFAGRERVEQHVRTCAACREARALDAEIDGLLAADAAPSAAPEFSARVRAALAGERGQPVRPSARPWRLVAAAAAAVLATATIYFARGGTVDDEDVVAHLDVAEELALEHEDETFALELGGADGDLPLSTLLRAARAEEF